MRIAEVGCIEVNEAGEESPIGLVGKRLEVEVHYAKGRGEFVGGERHAGNNAECATATAFQGPKQIGLASLVDDIWVVMLRPNLCCARS